MASISITVSLGFKAFSSSLLATLSERKQVSLKSPEGFLKRCVGLGMSEGSDDGGSSAWAALELPHCHLAPRAATNLGLGQS